MLQNEFATKFQELISEYRRLSQEVKTVTDDATRKAVMLQMQDNVRRQNALREEYLNKQGEN